MAFFRFFLLNLGDYRVFLNKVDSLTYRHILGNLLRRDNSLNLFNLYAVVFGKLSKLRIKLLVARGDVLKLNNLFKRKAEFNLTLSLGTERLFELFNI